MLELFQKLFSPNQDSLQNQDLPWSNSLRTILILTFVLQIVGAVGLVGYLSFKNGQQAVKEVASELGSEISLHISESVSSYLRTPHLINQTNADAIRLGQLDVNNQKSLERHFLQQIQTFDSLSRIYFSNPQGGLISIGNDDRGLSVAFTENFVKGRLLVEGVDPQGNRQKLLVDQANYDARERPFYQSATAIKRATWSPIYIYIPSSRGLGIAASYPFYDQEQQFRGVLSSDLSLVAISEFLQSLKISANGQAFILEQSGELVASSNLESSFIRTTDGQNKKRLQATESTEPLIRYTTQHLIDKFGNLTTINTAQKLNLDIEGNHHFAQITPLTDQFGLDWLIVVLVPESDFMKQINANTKTTIILCLATLIIAIVIGMMTAGRITKPILRLNSAAKEIAQGKWSQTVEIKRSDEVGQLAKSFNQMAAQLQESFAALQESENLLTQFLETVPVGVTVHDVTGKLIYANQAAKEILGIDSLPDTTTKQLAETYQVYLSGTEQLYSTENLPIVKALSGESHKVDDLEIHRQNLIIPLEVWATPIYDQTGKVSYAIVAFADITEYKQAQKFLANYNSSLESKVAERTAKLVNINEQLNQEVAERQRVEEILRESALRERMVARVLQQMHQTLDVDIIFSATTNELRRVLHCDRVVLYRFNPDWSGEFVAESVANGWMPLMVEQKNQSTLTQNAVEDRNCLVKTSTIKALWVQDTYLRDTKGGAYSQGASYRCTEDIYRAGFTPCYINLLEQFQARAYIIVPVFCSSQLWGLLASYQNSSTRSWSQAEISAVVQIGTQLGVALQQAQLLQQTQQQAVALEAAFDELKQTQAQLIHSEKMSSLGRMVAGIAHEINNPISFIYGNLTPADNYFQDLLSLIELYQQTYPQPTPEIQQLASEIEVDFLVKDWQKIISSMQTGAERIREIVLSLRNFSRLDETQVKAVDIHEGIDSTLLILQHRLKAQDNTAEIEVSKNYGQLPKVTCYASQLNQVFMHLLSNAIDALETQDPPRLITISTSVRTEDKEEFARQGEKSQFIESSQMTRSLSPPSAFSSQWVIIRIADNGIGMSEAVKQKIFDPFFTTKPVGSGRGLGLSTSYQIIVDKHQGNISCNSAPGQGTEFIVEIPVKQPPSVIQQ